LAILAALAAAPGFAGEATESSKPEPAAAKIKPPELPTMPELTDARIVQMAKASRLSSDVVRLAVEFIYKYKPRAARDLMTQLNKDPQKFRSAISEASYGARNLENLKRSDPARYARQEQMYALEAQSELLVDYYDAVGENQKPHVEVRLTEVLDKLFDLRLEEERYELDQLRKQVQATQDRIDQKASNKDRIVDRQLTRLLGIDEILTW
jgi:hypothetical protein